MLIGYGATRDVGVTNESIPPYVRVLHAPADGGPAHGMLQCNYVPPTSSSSVQMSMVFETTLEAFPVLQVTQSVAQELHVATSDVHVAVEAGSVVANIRVLATPLRIATIYAEALRITATPEEATRVLGVKVEQVASVQRVGESPSAPPSPPSAPPRPSHPPSAPPTQNVLTFSLNLRGTPQTIDTDALRGVIGITLRLGSFCAAAAGLEAPYGVESNDHSSMRAEGSGKQ